MTRFIHFILFLILVLDFSSTQAQSCYKAAWVKDFGGNSAYQGIVEGDRRPDGLFVIAGSFTSPNLTLGSLTITSPYSYSYYLAIHDSSGNFLNGVVFASGGTVTGLDVLSDGSVVVTGYWTGSIVVGNDTLENATRARLYVAKFTPDLQFQWLRKSAHTSADCFTYDVTTDLQKNVYICGTFEDNAFRIGDIEVTNSGGWNMWSNDAFLVKFDSNGVTQYVKSFGCSDDDDAALTITADSLGYLFVTGTTGGSNGMVHFPGNVALPGSFADNSAFLARLDAGTGETLWAKMLGGLYASSVLYVYDACLGDNNSLIISGTITGTISVPPFTYSASDQNCFVARFNTLGENEWLKQTGGQNGSEYGYYCFYHKGRIAVSGRLYSNQPYCADFPLYSTNSGSYSAFNALFTSQGQLIFARGNYALSNEYYPAVVLIDDSGNELYWGSYKGSQTWYPITKSAGTANVKTFLVRFVPFSPVPAFTMTAGPDKATTCGTNVQLTASVSPTAPFGWYPNLGFLPNGTKTPYVNPGYPTTYVFYSTYQGCVFSDSVFVDVTNYNNFTIDAGTDKDLCPGDSVQLVVTSNQTGLTYSWLPSGNLNSNTSQAPWAKPLYPTQFVVTASYGNCKAIDTVYVNQHGKPFINIPKQDLYYSTYRYHICEGNPIDVNLGDPQNTYNVLTPSLCSNINNNLITLHGNTPGGMLKVEAINQWGCTQKDSVNVLIHNNQTAPTILGYVPDRSACPGDTLQIIVWLTNSIQYNFQYSWYGGWQVDSMNGQGWKDISIYEHGYDVSNYSSGYGTSTYYTRLRFPAINADMDGFRYRCFVSDYCSPRAYSNAGTLNVAPKLTAQPPATKILCQNANDSISVNSSSTNVQYQWETLQAGTWTPLTEQPGIITSNGRYLRFHNIQTGIDSLQVRCVLSGCSASGQATSFPCLIRVVPAPAVLWQTHYETICPGQNDSLKVTTNSSFYTYLWYANNIALTGNNGQINGYNTNTLKFTPVNTNQAGVNYKLKISYQGCGFSTFSDTTGFHVIPIPTVTWPGGMIVSCDNAAPIVLSGGTPAGGTYSGPGVTGNIFDPTQVGLGSFILYYTVNSSTPGCTASAGKSVWIQAPPTVSWPGGNLSFCTTSSSYHLTGATPSFGTYSGPGVSGSWFYPSTAGPGVHTISYTYLNPSTGCSNVATRTFTVGNMPTVTWPGGNAWFCLSSPVFSLSGGLPAGGTYTGTGVNGATFDPQLAGIGTYTITYTYTDLVPTCTGSTTRSFIVGPDPIASWPGGQMNICLDDPADSCMGGLPPGGTYSGPGVTNGMFYPAAAGPGLFMLTYTYTDPLTGCQDEVTRNYFVDACTFLPETSADQLTLSHINGSMVLNFGSPVKECTVVRIFNPLGQQLFEESIPVGIQSWPLIFQTPYPGVFLIQTSQGGRTSNLIRSLNLR